MIGSGLDPHLVLLLEIQDLTSKARELDAGELGAVERAHFGVDPGEMARQIREKADELVQQLPMQVQRRYRRMAGRLDRAVVPVVGGTCYGCFVSIATAQAGEQEPNSALHTCEHCGRFIYILS
jgi:hypothetical protein